MIQICNVEILENPCSFLEPFKFKITFSAEKDVKSDEYQWKIVYVGSAESKDFDQVLLSESLGSYVKGQHDFILHSAPVDPDKIPKEELTLPSVVLLVGFHQHKQFFQVGYIVAKEYLDDEVPDAITDYSKLQRYILLNSARIIADDDDDLGMKNESFNDTILGSIGNSSLNAWNSFLSDVYSDSDATLNDSLLEKKKDF